MLLNISQTDLSLTLKWEEIPWSGEVMQCPQSHKVNKPQACAQTCLISCHHFLYDLQDNN